MYVVNDASPVLTGCTFAGNSAGAGGAMATWFGSSPTIENCQFINNEVTGFGGALDCFNLSNPVMTDCLFSGNDSQFRGGGATVSAGSAPVFTNCSFSDNTAGDVGGGMYVVNDASPVLTGCTLSGNTSVLGGALANLNSSSSALANCVLWGNSRDQIFDDFDSVTTVQYSDVESGFPGIGNIDADPLFVDPDNGDYRLSPGSPCIDAGDNTAVPQDITTDLDGNPRFLEIPETPDTGNGTLPIVDMGAFESLGGGCLAVTSQEIVCHADGTTFTVNVEGLNACTGGTTQVTFTASGGAVGEELCFTALVNDGGFCCSTEICVTIPDCTPSCDLNGDGNVGIVDFLNLLANWGLCP